ncbi:hypothetical protein GGR54DRAFT_622514 [Hypoxylon sp. NC1633]|nr:hypothetical protein GGR54DRAFT_622514 [Hypoxylon sp. NC1633]
MNVGQPIPAFSCQDAMRMVLDKCDNENHGGTAVVGCVVYDYSLVNLGDTDCSSPFS